MRLVRVRSLTADMRGTVKKSLSMLLIKLLCLSPTVFAATNSTATSKTANGVATAPFVSIIEVNTNNDADNLNPAVGCDTDSVVAGDQCSLRAAIQRANALAGDDEIRFNIPSTQPNCDPSVNRCTINLSKELPDLSTNVRIESPGIDKITVRRMSGSGDYRVFRATFASLVTLSGLRIENGKPAGISSGGAVTNDGSGVVNIIDSILTDNFAGAIAGSGGAVANNSSGTINITNSLVAGNEATGSGGGVSNGGSGTVNITGSGIYHNAVKLPVVANSSGGGGGVANSATGAVNIINSVVNENTVAGGDPGTSVLRGAGIYNISTGPINVTDTAVFNNLLDGGGGGGIASGAGNVVVSNSTITGNRGNIGGGLFGEMTVKSSVIAKNNVAPSSGSDVSGNFTSAGYNLIGVADGAAGFNSNTDQTGTVAIPLDPKLDPAGTAVSIPAFPLQAPGAPLCGSPLIDKGIGSGLSTDMRGAGFQRTIDDTSVTNAADGTDIGAIERQSICVQLAFTVNSTEDADDVNAGDGICDTDSVTAGSQCTLRAALKEANSIAGDYSINFSIPNTDPGFDPATGRHTINLSSPLQEITNSNLVINGPGYDKLTVRRNTGGFYRIFSFGGVVETATIAGMTVSNGFTASDGGAVLFTGLALNVNGSVFNDNTSGLSGGAIYANARLVVTDSVFNGNFAGNTFQFGGGGAIYARGTLDIKNTSFNDNLTSGRGGGVSTENFQGTNESSISNSTFTGNGADAGGGLAVSNGNALMRVTNCTFRRNTSDLINSQGGGIYHSFGKLNVEGSTLVANEGWGIAINTAGNMTTNIVDSTINDNVRGGIQTEQTNLVAGKLNVTNSTIAGNIAGPGISLSRIDINVTNSTIANNENGGITNTVSSGTGTWTVKSTILAGNGAYPDLIGTFVSAGFNLIGKVDATTGFANGVNNDQVGNSSSPIDPGLDSLGLKDNGGPTQTIALQADSPAVDKGTAASLNSPLVNDQRGNGFVRTFNNGTITDAGDGTDIGAFELQPGGPTPTPTPTPSPSPSPSPTSSPTPTPSPSPTPNPSPSPTPTPAPGGARLVVTVSPLVRTNCGTLIVAVTIQNTGNTTAQNVRLTAATLTSPTTNGSPVPQNLGSIAIGQFTTTILTFSASGNPSGSKRTLKVDGTYTGGTFTEKWKVNLP